MKMPDSLPTHCDLAVYTSGPAIMLTPITIDGVTIPAGEPTDLASTPRILWAIFPPWGPYLMAALAHDYHYRHQDVSRKEADQRFLRIMRWYNVGIVRRSLMYWAVRLFGWGPWRRNAKQRADVGEAFNSCPPTKDEE